MTGKYYCIKILKKQGEKGKRQLSVGIPRKLQKMFDLKENDYVLVENRDEGIYIRKINKEETKIGDYFLLSNVEIDYNMDAELPSLELLQKK